MMPDMSSIPEVDPLHSLPRIRVPSLMFSGEFDPIVSRAHSEKFFELIGVSPERPEGPCDGLRIHEQVRGRLGPVRVARRR